MGYPAILGVHVPGILAALAAPYERFFPALAIDLVAIVALAYGVYYRRHHRRDLVLAYVCFNVGLFVVVMVLTLVQATPAAGLALGLGLFGALSMVRLRSEELTYREIAYFFSALAIAISNGVGVELLFAGVLSGLVVVTMGTMEALEPWRPVERLSLVLDQVFPDEAALRAELERRLGVNVIEVTVTELDYVRDITRLEAKYSRTRPEVGRALLEDAEAGARGER
jgi:hypothetical protein